MVKIDNEFKELIPALNSQDYKELEESLVEEGCRDPICLWNGTIVDGHNRYEICTKHKIYFKTRDLKFADRNAVKIWIIKNQLSRRNLNDYQRTKLVILRSTFIQEKALENLKTPTGGIKRMTLQNSAKSPINAREEMAKLADVSHDTVHRVKVIEEHATKQIKEDLDKNKISINQAYKQVKTKIAKIKPTPKPKDIKLSETLIQGNCLEELDQIQNKTIDLIYVDPPYFILSQERAEWDTFKNEKEFWDFTKQWLTKLIPKLKDTGRIFISFSQEYMWKLYTIMDEFFVQQQDLIFSNCIVWNYRNNMKPNNRKLFKYTWEPVFYYRKKDAPQLNIPEGNWEGLNGNSDVWTIAMPQSNFVQDKREHPTQKPIELLRNIIKYGSKEEDLVLDCFAGSGTTAAAAREQKRNWILIEQDKEYIKLIKRRLEL